MITKNRVFKLFIVFFALFSQSFYLNAQTLPSDSPERKQLIAMGYEIDKEDEGDDWTIARIGSSSIGLSKSKNWLAVVRMFTRQKLKSTTDEIELYKEVNRLNIDLSYQTVIHDGSIWFVLYDFGDYNPKDFAKIIRLAEKADTIFDAYPKLLELLNGE